MTRTHILWLVWFVATVSAGAAMAVAMIYQGPRSSFLIGKTTSGHHQIELACETCHTDPFGGKEVFQDACLKCHKDELKESDDSHPMKKFRDPRNADRLAKLNAMQCITCHTEHNEGVTSKMGVTMPTDYCFLCHEEIGKDRPWTHQNLDFKTCASAGCHRYHDNRALYEDFLDKHKNAPEQMLEQFVKLRVQAEEDAAAADKAELLTKEAADAPEVKKADAKLLDAWHNDAHATNGVNCSKCHQPKKDTAWSDQVPMKVCATCHGNEAKSFVRGKHGMRLADGLFSSRSGPLGLFDEKPLSPMTPAMSRIPMKGDAHGRDLTCTTCHGAHEFDVVKAQVEGCLSCHDDKHSTSFVGSPHHELWKQEVAGQGKTGTGVSCATCHMPRGKIDDGWEETLFVNHNQNDNLRPNDKMIRSVCMDCHGLGFTIDALADKELISKNFSGRPNTHVESIDWVIKRNKYLEEKRKKSAEK